jgi:hypothetical protein
VVTGFKGGTWYAVSGNLTVRNNDAHAWCEIWDAANAVWLRVDPTPGATAVATGNEPGGAAALARRLDSSWSARLDSLRVVWYRRIVNFDQRTQLNTIRSVRDAAQSGSRRLQTSLDQGLRAVRDWLTTPWDTTRVIRAVALAIVAAGLFWGVRMLAQGWRWRRGGDEARGRQDPVRIEAGRWLRRLDDGGPVAAAGTDSFSELVRLRYGPRASWPEPGAAFRRARVTWKEQRRRRRISR